MKRKTDLTEEQVLMIMHQYRLGIDSRETASYIGCSQAFISTIVKAFNGSIKKLDVLARDHAELILKLSPFYTEPQHILNTEEDKALKITSELWNQLIKMEQIISFHPDDMKEHSRDIHNIQNRIMSRMYMKNSKK